MQQSHGLGYAEYANSIEKRIRVERDREKDYKQCSKMAAEREGRL
ncbi:hypothetical protein [Tuberibacillus sp. Marseille-P3662]|nr:hypothetical protein [Tuberibacillus sp. Marseille-P3662]